MSRKCKFLVVGAGLFGAVMANRLARYGHDVTVVDQRNHVAGNCYTSNFSGIDVHEYGAHIFHTDSDKIWKFVNRYSEFIEYTHQVIANYNGKLYNLPFNMNTFNRLWGVNTPFIAQDKISKEIEFEKSIGTFNDLSDLESYAISQVGREIFLKLIKGYTEKQWGRDCKELPASIIKRIPIRYNYDNNYFDDKYQGIPKLGYTELTKKILSEYKVRVVLNKKVDLNLLEFFKDDYHKIIYTGSIDELFDYKFGELEYRSLRFESSVLPNENVQGCAVMNYTGPNELFTRVIEHKHFNKYSKSDVSIVTYEYSQKWDKTKPRYYPISNDINNALYERYLEYSKIKLPNVVYGGRLGEYKYYDMDDVIESAFNKSTKIISEL